VVEGKRLRHVKSQGVGPREKLGSQGFDKAILWQPTLSERKMGREEKLSAMKREKVAQSQISKKTFIGKDRGCD